MMQSTFGIRTEFPLTPNPKVNRRTFPAPSSYSVPLSPSADFGIKLGDGVIASRRVLNARPPQVAVITKDLTAPPEQSEPGATIVDPTESPALAGIHGIPGYARPETAGANAEPDAEVQQQIAGIWKEVLGIQETGIGDNLFALGGHSLLATSVFSRIEAMYVLSLPLRTTFESPTIRGLAKQPEILLWTTSKASSYDASGGREQKEP